MQVMNPPAGYFEFVGAGRRDALDLSRVRPWGGAIGPWIPGEGRTPIADETARDHPSGYVACAGLVDAVNTALILRKPLLLTGNPGTGKTQLAERIAWEFNIGPVLRFEAQSLSEAGELFYRFDLVRHVAASQLAASQNRSAVDPTNFASFGPLGKAILRSNPYAGEHRGLWSIAFPEPSLGDVPRPSVVLIDEIDKASRDFPNDLLNAIERLEVPIREIPGHTLRVAEEDSLRPIIIVTSNSERELPPPFLRRCVYFHIPDPPEDLLRKIVRLRVFPEVSDRDSAAALPPLFEDMLRFFVHQRGDKSVMLGYASGPSELIDWSRAVRQAGAEGRTGGMKDNVTLVTRTLSAFAKHRDDGALLLKNLESWIATPIRSS